MTHGLRIHHGPMLAPDWLPPPPTRICLISGPLHSFADRQLTSVWRRCSGLSRVHLNATVDKVAVNALALGLVRALHSHAAGDASSHHAPHYTTLSLIKKGQSRIPGQAQPKYSVTKSGMHKRKHVSRLASILVQKLQLNCLAL